MSDNAQFKREPAVRFERLLPGPVEYIWDVLTEINQLPGWYGEGSIEPREGGKVTLMDGHIRGIITQWRPGRRLAYTWNVFSPGQEESDYPESYLTFEIIPKEEDNFLLTLTHLPILERFEKQNAMGWHTFLDMLEAAVRGNTIQERPVYMKQNAARYGVDLANLVR